MKYSFVAGLLALMFAIPSWAAELPTLSLNSSGAPEQVSITKPAGLQAYTEVPPWFIPGGWRSFAISTAWTYLCSSPDSLISKLVSFTAGNCTKVTDVNTSSVWARNYYGIFSMHWDDPSGRSIGYAAMHGENKNEILLDGTILQNTVNQNFSTNANLDVTKCADGLKSGVYTSCWDAYHAFVGMTHTTISQGTNWGQVKWIDDGPIVWPEDGYVKSDGSKASSGVRHPTFFANNGYLYVYYIDTSLSSWGVKVARAQIGNPTKASDFRVYDGSGFSSPSLPLGFSAGNASAYLDDKGGNSKAIFGSNYDPARFAVARIAQTNYFIGVEEYVQNGWKIALRVSDDLVHWSDPLVVYSKGSSWDSGDLHYPIFLSSDGWSNEEVDPKQFYLVGTDGSANVKIITLSVGVKEPQKENSVPTQTTVPSTFVPPPAKPILSTTSPVPTQTTLPATSLTQSNSPISSIKATLSTTLLTPGATRSSTIKPTAPKLVCPVLPYNLSYGSRGTSVTALQTFLAQYPDLYPEGTVSGYYGLLTEAAIKRFQVNKSIVSYGSPSTTGWGAVGPRTRAALINCTS